MTTEKDKSTIARITSGSNAYGTSVKSSDNDIVVIRFASKQQLLGLRGQNVSQSHSSNLDTVAMTLNHFFSLSLKGAPNMMELLWMKNTKGSYSTCWDRVLRNRSLFINENTAKPFLGMTGNQIKRASRKESEGNFEGAWKPRMHAIRLMEQALELLKHGGITFPRPNKHLLLSIRNGEMPIEDFTNYYNTTRDELERVADWPCFSRDERYSYKKNRAQLEDLLVALNYEWLTTNEKER